MSSFERGGMATSLLYDVPKSDGDVSRAAVHILDQYHRARMTFATGLADLASDAEVAGSLQSLGAMVLLKPLLQDSLPSVQNAAILALGRLANSSEEWARDIVQRGLLPGLVLALGTHHRQQRKAATFALKAVARHPMRVQDLVEAGAIPALVDCLVDPNPTVKETAASALGHMARFSEHLARRLVDTGAVRLMTLNLQDADLGVQRMSLSAIGDVVKHSSELANEVLQPNTVASIVALVASLDERVKRQAVMCLGQIVKHDEQLAQAVVESEGFMNLLVCLGGSDDSAKRGVAGLLRDIVRLSPKLAWKVNSFGAAGPLIDFSSTAAGHHKLSGITALGYMASYSEDAALAIIVSGGVKPLVHCLNSEADESVRIASAWALSQLGSHSPGHARSVAGEGGLLSLVDAMKILGSSENSIKLSGSSENSRKILGSSESSVKLSGGSENLRQKCRKGVLTILENLMHVAALVSLLMRDDLAYEILDKLLGRLSFVLSKDGSARATFHLLHGFSRLEQFRTIVSERRTESLMYAHNHELEMFWTSISDRIETILGLEPLDDGDDVSQENHLTAVHSVPVRRKTLDMSSSLGREHSKSIVGEDVAVFDATEGDNTVDESLSTAQSLKRDALKVFSRSLTAIT